MAGRGIKAQPGIYTDPTASKRQTELEQAIRESERLKEQLGPEAYRLYRSGKLSGQDVAEVIAARAAFPAS